MPYLCRLKFYNNMQEIKQPDFGCHLFKTELVAEILSQMDDRVDIMEVVEEIRYIEGINIIEMWRNLI